MYFFLELRIYFLKQAVAKHAQSLNGYDNVFFLTIAYHKFFFCFSVCETEYSMCHRTKYMLARSHKSQVTTHKRRSLEQTQTTFKNHQPLWINK